MTPVERTEAAVNSRIEKIHANLREEASETARQVLVQSLVVCFGMSEALVGYVQNIAQYARARHGALKETHATLSAQHGDLLNAGKEMLERFKANPTDRALRKEIEGVQRQMESIQKTLRRGADSLQRELAPSMAMIDPLAVSIRRLAEADQLDALKRATKAVLEHVRDLYQAQPGLPAKDVLDRDSWEESALSAIDQATGFYDAFARAGYQAILALDVMTMAVSDTPPQTAEEASNRANASVAARLKDIAKRLAAG